MEMGSGPTAGEERSLRNGITGNNDLLLPRLVISEEGTLFRADNNTRGDDVLLGQCDYFLCLAASACAKARTRDAIFILS